MAFEVEHFGLVCASGIGDQLNRFLAFRPSVLTARVFLRAIYENTVRFICETVWC